MYFETYHFEFESRPSGPSNQDGFASIVAGTPDEPGVVLADCSYSGGVDVRRFLLDKAYRYLASDAREVSEGCPVIDVYGLDARPMEAEETP